jgi:hypothetical protein
MSETYIFEGTLWPGLIAKFGCEFADAAVGGGFAVEYVVVKRRVVATCQAPQPVEDLPTLKHIVQRIAQDHLNAMGLAGAGFHSLELTHIKWSTGNGEFGQPGELPGMELLGPTEALALLQREQDLRWAVDDFRLALFAPEETAFHCFRLLERLRDLVTSPAAQPSRNARWTALRSHLGIERAEIDALTAASQATRHGVSRTTPWEERLPFLQLAHRALISYAKRLPGPG